MHLVNGSYEERAQSAVLFPLSAGVIAEFLAKRAAMPAPAWRKMVRDWARLHSPV